MKKRLWTQEVRIGDLILGGNAPIRLQSITNTDTLDIKATVEQCIRMIDAGAELVRITTPSLAEGKALKTIQEELRKQGIKTPLVADVHFTPNVAEYVAQFVEKVRINPGNYADKKKFNQLEYTPYEYEAELERIRNKFLPLVRICKTNGTALRIGTNHGSLSDRIMSHYGDTPLGMVQSALEFLDICEAEQFHNIVLSMKSSNPLVMVEAYRLLVLKMQERGRIYPLHLGVTEAGDGEDGRIKSAVGMGSLLQDGIGDTLRVSLTEEPELELPVAQKLAHYYKEYTIDSSYHYTPLASFTPKVQKLTPIVVGNFSGRAYFEHFKDQTNIQPKDLNAFGYFYTSVQDKWSLTERACEALYIYDLALDFNPPNNLKLFQSWDATYTHTQAQKLPSEGKEPILTINGTDYWVFPHKGQPTSSVLEQLKALKEEGRHILYYTQYHETDLETLQLQAAADLGYLLMHHLIDGIWLASETQDLKAINELVFGILQATRQRISKTEYIACPSCGRTLFNLQDTTAKIREKTAHLKGLKIGIMGCIVNGPGEMADADFGYVGTGKGKITLYKGQEIVQRNVPEEQAVDALIDLIKAHGKWVDI